MLKLAHLNDDRNDKLARTLFSPSYKLWLCLWNGNSRVFS